MTLNPIIQKETLDDLIQELRRVELKTPVVSLIPHRLPGRLAERTASLRPKRHYLDMPIHSQLVSRLAPDLNARG